METLEEQTCITDVLKTAALCVRNCSMTSLLASTCEGMEDEGDELLDGATIMTFLELALPDEICLVADRATNVNDDLVVVQVGETQAVIGVVSQDGECAYPDIISYNELLESLAFVSTDILLPYTRFEGGVMVFAGLAAQQMAAANGMTITPIRHVAHESIHSFYSYGHHFAPNNQHLGR
ncbi:MAG: hypothetical protein V4713_05570 [Pseudomonadota bacterium]